MTSPKEQSQLIALANDLQSAIDRLGSLTGRQRLDDEGRESLFRLEAARTEIRRREKRNQLFDCLELFIDPAWNMLLDLYVATRENRDVGVNSLCIASKVPTTTALRWITAMSAAGLFRREADPTDGRRHFVRMTQRAREIMDEYLT